MAPWQKEMVLNERRRLAAIAEGLTGRARALLGVFLLSTSVGCVSMGVMERGSVPDRHNPYSMVKGKTSSGVGSENLWEAMHTDDQFIWGIEYVPKEREGGAMLAQRYVRIDRGTGKQTVLGEYDTVFQAAAGAASIPGIPARMRERSQRDVSIVQSEADLLAKGWVALPDGKHGVSVPGSETLRGDITVHTEVRRVYDDTGFDVITIWDVDASGRDVGYRTTQKGEREYERYLRIIEEDSSRP